MGRMTRAKAAEVAEKLHIDEDAVLELPSDARTPEKAEDGRPPLGELTPNSAGSAQKEEVAAEERRVKVKKAPRKIAKGRKNAAGSGVKVEMGDSAEVVLDDREAVESPAGETAAEGWAKEVSEWERLSHRTVHDLEQREDQGVPLPDTVAETRSSEELDHKLPQGKEQENVQTAAEEPREDTLPAAVEAEHSQTADAHDTVAEVTSDVSPQEHVQEAPGSPKLTAKPRVIEALRKDTPAKRSTSNKENVEPSTPATTEPSVTIERQSTPAVPTPIMSASPQRALVPERRSSRAEDAIEAIDALEDAIEKVADSVPKVPISPEVKRVKRAPSVRTTKAVEARLSMARGRPDSGKGPALGRASSIRQSTTLGRAGSIRESIKARTEPVTNARVTSATRKTSSTKPALDAAPVEKKEAVIPHSKPRPVSLSFPTPPPPPKSTKAPTRSAFQLPGEAIAAKLKAAREERKLKEEEETKAKPAFKARPAPTMLSKAPSVRQTASSKARESLMLGKESSATGVKRASSVRTTTTTKRDSTLPSKRLSTTIPAKPAPAQIHVAKRGSMIAPTPKPRLSSTTTNTPSTITEKPRVPSKGTHKGREVFGRAQQAKEAAEREKRAKEEAARKARAVAAERGRVASREWAEKRARKTGKGAAEAGVKEAAEVREVRDVVAFAEEVTFEGKPGEVVERGVGVPAEGVPAGEAAVVEGV